MTETAVKLPIGNIDGWLVTAVANPLRDAGNKPVPRVELERMTAIRVGATRDTDGYTVARANNRPDEEGPGIIISESLRLLREQNWLTGPDEALHWCGPDGSLTIRVGFRTIKLPSLPEREASRRRSLASIITRAQAGPVLVTVGKSLKKFAVHPLALLIPGMTPDDLERLYADITISGTIHEPLVIFENKVLDGRHRLVVAHLTGIPVKTRLFDGDKAAAQAYVFSANITRRHLTLTQLALAAEKFGFISEAKTETNQPEKREEIVTSPPVNNTPPTPSPENNIPSRTASGARIPSWAGIASKKTGGAVSPRTLERFDAAQVTDAPETVARIESGEIKSINQAVKEAARELGTETVPPIFHTAFSRMGCARGDLIAAQQSLKTTPQRSEKITERIIELRQLLIDIEKFVN